MGRLQLRDGHGDGLCCIAWDTVGRHLITGGADCRMLIHTWDPSLASAVVASSSSHTGPITTLAVSPLGTLLATGSVDHSVKFYDYPGGEFQSTVTRFTLPIRSIAFSVTGGILAAAGDDAGIRLVSTIDNSIVKVLKGHATPVMSMALDPKNEYLASVDTDGTVIFWLISSGKMLHTLVNCAPRIDVKSTCKNHLAWEPEGNMLAAPGSKSDVVMLDRDTGEKVYSLKGGHTSPVSFLAWSPNGKYIATSAEDRQVLLWDTEKKQDLDRLKFDSPICSLAWKPKGNAVAIIDVEGRFSVWESAIPSHMTSPSAVLNGTVNVVNREELLKFSDDEASDEIGVSIALGSQDTDSESNDAGIDAAKRGKKLLKRRHKYSSPSKDLERSQKNLRQDIDSYDTNQISSMQKLPMLQKPFQAGCTAQVSGKRRFLAYNLLGSISSTENDGYFHVEVEFHDIGRGVRVPAMTDYFGFTMGALNEKGCILASPQKGEKNPSTLMYRPFNAWASNSEWSMRLPIGEEAQAVAIGVGWSAVSTSHNLLRLFSEGGLQKFVMSLPGPIVSMTGHVHLLALVFHASIPFINGGQVIDFVVLNVPEKKCQLKGRLPLSPGARLSWVGFSESGFLAAYDSQGLLRMYCPDFDGCWIPVFSAEKEKKDSNENYWMVGLSDNQIFCVICKYPEVEPQAFPRPVLSIINMALPSLHSGLGADDLESGSLCNAMILAQAQAKADEVAAEGQEVDKADDRVLEVKAELDRDLLRLIAVACKGDKLMKAMELATSLSLHKSLEGAIRLVNAMRLPVLAERLNGVLEERMQQRNSGVVLNGIQSANAAPRWSGIDKEGRANPLTESSPQSTSKEMHRVPAETGAAHESTAGMQVNNKEAPRCTLRPTKEHDSLQHVDGDVQKSEKLTNAANITKASNPFAKTSNPFAKSAPQGNGNASKVPLLDSLKRMQNDTTNNALSSSKKKIQKGST